MELPSKRLKIIVFNTRHKIGEHMLIVVVKFTHEEPLPQPLQTNNKQFKIAVTFVISYKGIDNVIRKYDIFIFIFVFKDAEFNATHIPPGAYEIESLNIEIKRIIINKAYATDEVYLFEIKLNYSILQSFTEVQPGGRWQISFVKDDTLRDLLGIKPKVGHDE